FSDYFYDFAGAIYGKRPSQLTFDRVSVAGKIGMTGLQLVKVEFNTDLGPASSALAVKIFSDGNQAKEEVIKIQHVKKRIANFSNHGIKTADVLFYAGPVIVMEGIRGESFRASPVPLTEKYRMAGRALAALHGDTDNPVVNDKNRALVKLIVPKLPIDEETKKRILARFDELFSKLDNNRGGTIAMGDFHPGNIIDTISPPD
ncbi:MAG: phosphotransferase, partial [Candidatus Hodarchaeales archaeon]